MSGRIPPPPSSNGGRFRPADNSQSPERRLRPSHSHHSPADRYHYPRPGYDYRPPGLSSTHPQRPPHESDWPPQPYAFAPIPDRRPYDRHSYGTYYDDGRWDRQAAGQQSSYRRTTSAALNYGEHLSPALATSDRTTAATAYGSGYAPPYDSRSKSPPPKQQQQQQQQQPVAAQPEQRSVKRSEPIPRLTDKADWMLVFDPQLPRQSGMPVVGNGKEMIVRRNGVNPVEPITVTSKQPPPTDPRKGSATAVVGRKCRHLVQTMQPVLLEMDSHWEAPEPPAAVVASNLPPTVSSQDVLTYFSRHGSVDRADLLNHPVSGVSLGIARLIFKPPLPAEEDAAATAATSAERPSEKAAERRRQYKLAIAAAKHAVKAENGNTLLGSVLRVELDPFGYVLRRLISAVAQQQQTQEDDGRSEELQPPLPHSQRTRSSNYYDADYYDQQRHYYDRQVTAPPADYAAYGDPYARSSSTVRDEGRRYAGAYPQPARHSTYVENNYSLLIIPFTSLPASGRVTRHILLSFLADYRPSGTWKDRDGWIVEFRSVGDRDYCMSGLDGRYLFDYRLSMQALPSSSAQYSSSSRSQSFDYQNVYSSRQRLSSPRKSASLPQKSTEPISKPPSPDRAAPPASPKHYSRDELLTEGCHLICNQLSRDFVKDLKSRVLTNLVQEFLTEWLAEHPPPEPQELRQSDLLPNNSAANSVPSDSRRPSETIDSETGRVGTPPPAIRSGLDLYLQSMSALRKRKQAAQNLLRLKRKQLLKAMRAAAEPHVPPAEQQQTMAGPAGDKAVAADSDRLQTISREGSVEASADVESKLPAKKRRPRSLSPKASPLTVETSTGNDGKSDEHNEHSELSDTGESAVGEDQMDEQPPEISLFDVINEAIAVGTTTKDGVATNAEEELQRLGLPLDPAELEDFHYLQLALDSLTGGKSPDASLDQPAHASGCARAEGYYVIPEAEKSKYLPHRNRALLRESLSALQSMPMITHRENRANHRRLVTGLEEVKQQSATNSSDILKFNQLKARKKRIKFAKSGIHDWGLFAMEHIDAQDMVIEYIGEVIRQKVADHREKAYEKIGIGSSYLFRLDDDLIIDATFAGNLARFINHSCEPNCIAKIITVDNEKKIVIYASKDIEPGEEITYDYKFPIEDEKIPCLCGAPGCRGTLN